MGYIQVFRCLSHAGPGTYRPLPRFVRIGARSPGSRPPTRLPTTVPVPHEELETTQPLGAAQYGLASKLILLVLEARTGSHIPANKRAGGAGGDNRSGPSAMRSRLSSPRHARVGGGMTTFRLDRGGGGRGPWERRAATSALSEAIPWGEA